MQHVRLIHVVYTDTFYSYISIVDSRRIVMKTPRCCIETMRVLPLQPRRIASTGTIRKWVSKRGSSRSMPPVRLDLGVHSKEFVKTKKAVYFANILRKKTKRLISHYFAATLMRFPENPHRLYVRCLEIGTCHCDDHILFESKHYKLG